SVQNDRVKKRVLLLNDGIPMLNRRASDSKFDVITIQHPAICYIYTMLVDRGALRLIKDNHSFIEHVKLLISTYSDDLALQQTANRIIWKAEKETQCIAKAEERIALKHIQTKRLEPQQNIELFIWKPDDKFSRKAIQEESQQQSSSSPPPVYVAGQEGQNPTGPVKKYDFMISYCHINKDLCHKIYYQLKETNAYSIWIDKELAEVSATEITDVHMLLVLLSHPLAGLPY
ncbi:unnamed protein product, partial [Didymodactylos carnosus]